MSDMYELCEPVVEYMKKPASVLATNINANIVSDMEDMTFEEFIETLPPAKRRIALSSVGLFVKKCHKASGRVRSSEDIYNIMHADLAYLNHEEMHCLMLNQAGKIIRKIRLSIGGIAGATVDVRLILREALLCRAVAIVMAHNHPSGNTNPSRDDDELTKSVKKAAETMNIRLLDHLIITDGAYHSYSDYGSL